MEWTKPEFSKSKVDEAGRALANPLAQYAEYAEALTIVNNFRSSHSFPLNTLQNGLRHKANQVYADSLIAQRIKRLSSIKQKLQRTSTRLSQMQDLGGCRAVVKSIPQVRSLLNLHLHSGMKHNIDHVDDYISDPRKSGYRGIHLVYRYNSDRHATFNGLKIEVQLRSHLQHLWATAVETVGTFTKQALKASSGEAEWLRFFCLMGTAFADREKTARIPDTPSSKTELRKELRHHARKLKVEDHLHSYNLAFELAEEHAQAGARYFLVELDFDDRTIRVRGYRTGELAQAQEEYLEAERQTGSRDAVLVSVESMAALRRAYPNYFLDTKSFVRVMNHVIGE